MCPARQSLRQEWLSCYETSRELSEKAESVINNASVDFDTDDWLSLAIFAIDQAAISDDDTLYDIAKRLNRIRIFRPRAEEPKHGRPSIFTMGLCQTGEDPQ